ncbi:MAG: SH3 domain-containing protein [Bacteriovoracaceae bacterium]|nr:SH3 domain-containing protein [Bacteriovoracaceae bacterium]
MKLFIICSALLINTTFAQTQKFICTDGYVSNLRADAQADAALVTQLPKYTPLIVLEEKEGWTKVKSKSFEGWIFNKLLDSSYSCVLSTKSYKTHESYTSRTVHKYRENVLTGEGFRILKTEMGMTQVKDKTGNVFWLENHILWPKNNLMSLSI